MSFTRFSPEAASEIAANGCDLAKTLDGKIERLSALFKALGHEGRLAILCHLTSGEKSVTELETLLDQRQAAVSQQLARLRLEGLVSTRRDGKAIYYSLVESDLFALLHALPGLELAARA